MKNLLISAFCMLLVGCTSSYIGKPIRQLNPWPCTFSSFPHYCYDIKSNHLAIDYSISESDTTGEYIFSGVVRWVGGSDTPWMRSGQGFLKLLIGTDAVVDVFNFGIHINKNGETKFRYTFKTDHNFNSSLVGYQLRIRG